MNPARLFSLGFLCCLLLVFAQGESAATEKVLHNFGQGSDGSVPFAGVTFDNQGNLYGTASGGGHSGCDLGCGVVYRLSPNGDGTWSETVLHEFTQSDGGNPYSPMAIDSHGDLYGTTLYYGAGCGTAFQLLPNSNGPWIENTLHYFQCGNDGGSSYGMQFDQSGHLFGTAYIAGSGQDGLVFNLVHGSPASWTEVVLYSFLGGNNDGNAPVGNLAFDSNGDIFGTTYVGGPHLSGTVFKLSHLGASQYRETILYYFQGQAFGNSPDGANPTAGVVMDSAGNLYGTTDYGGPAGVGVVFKLTRNANGSYTESVLYRFADGQDGGHPYGGVILDQHGNLYGTTQGHNGPGTVYKLSPGSGGQWTETILHQFQGGTDGAVPYGGVTMDQSGNLYGTAAFGGQFGGGIVFEITP